MMSFGPSQTTRAVRILLIANFVVYVLQWIPYVGNFIYNWGALVPHEAFGHLQIWRFVSYMFLHDTSTPFHILFNMLVLWMFGVEIEKLLGTARFSVFYFICGTGSGLFSVFNLFHAAAMNGSIIGASGAVLGVLTIYAWYFPARQVLLFFILPVNIRVLVIGYALLSLFLSFQPNSVISHLTHLGGIVVAVLYVKLYPSVIGWFDERRERAAENYARERVRRDADRKKYFEETVDPILDKIAKYGMESLSGKEKAILKEAAHRDRERLKKNKILPFDLFR